MLRLQKRFDGKIVKVAFGFYPSYGQLAVAYGLALIVLYLESVVFHYSYAKPL